MQHATTTFRMKHAYIAAALLLNGCASDPQLSYYRFTPMVVPDSQTGDVTLEAKVVGGPVEVRFAPAAGLGEITLLDDGTGADATAGDGIYSLSVSPSDILHDFAADDVHRNFVGYLRLYSGSTQLSQINLFVDILTTDIPPVAVTAVSPSVQYSDHLVNIFDAAFFSTPNLQSVAQKFYAEFPDNYDFINIVYEVPHPSNRNHDIISNDVANIGVPARSNAGAWGSAGRLLGRTIFPIPTFFDGASPDYNHELGHQWINFLSLPPLDFANPHWPLSDLASGVMGWGQGPNAQGLAFNFNLAPSGADFLLTPNTNPKVFTDLSLYLMGMVGPTDVTDHFVFNDQSQTPVSGGLMSGPVTTVTITDVISTMGARNPDHTQSPKKFRIATILVSKDGLISADVMRFYDYFAARAEGTAIVPFASGFTKGLSNPFHLATGRRGWLDTRIMHRVLVDASRDGGVWWHPQAGPFDPATPHQGQLLADHLRSKGYVVDELARSTAITSGLLRGYDIVIRAGGFGSYAPNEISAYHDHVQSGGKLLLLADHATHAPADDLALSFGIRFEGATRGANQLTGYATHPITDGVGPLFYNVGSGLRSYPPSTQILGSLSDQSFLDLNNNGARDPNESPAPLVLGTVAFGAGRIVFCGDVNIWQGIPQPLLRNLLAWFERP